jgi:flagellin-specific chaperone FliS
MKKLIAIFLLIMITVSCNSQKVYSDFDISYSKSGGYAPIYENLLIKGNEAHYSFEGQGKKIKTSFKLTNEEIQNLNQVLTQNNFRHIAEDHKKIYDRVAVSINVKNGENSANKTDASMIMPQFQKNWDQIVNTFQNIISKNVKNTP